MVSYRVVTQVITDFIVGIDWLFHQSSYYCYIPPPSLPHDECQEILWLWIWARNCREDKAIYWGFIKFSLCDSYNIKYWKSMILPKSFLGIPTLYIDVLNPYCMWLILIVFWDIINIAWYIISEHQLNHYSKGCHNVELIISASFLEHN